MLKIFITLFIGFSLCNDASAQTGCVRTALQTRIYTSLQSGSNYRSTTFTNAAPGCQYVLTGNVCTVSGFTGTAFKGQVGVVNCPLDNNSWAFMAFIMGISYFLIAKREIENKEVKTMPKLK